MLVRFRDYATRELLYETQMDVVPRKDEGITFPSGREARVAHVAYIVDYTPPERTWGEHTIAEVYVL